MASRDNCACRLLYDQLTMMPMTSLSLLGIQATAPLPPQLGVMPLQSPSRPSTSSNQISCVENCCPWIQLYRRVAGDLRNNTVDPRRLLLQLDTLPSTNSTVLDKVRIYPVFMPRLGQNRNVLNMSVCSSATNRPRPPICNLKNTDGWKKNWLIFGLAELSLKLKKSAKIRLITKKMRLKFSWLQAITVELLNLNCQRERCRPTIVVVVFFFDVTKPASICNHKKFRNHENDSLQITRSVAHLLGVDFTLLFEYQYFFRRIFGWENSAANSASRILFGGFSVDNNLEV